MGLFSKLKEGLTKTRDNIVSGIDSVFSGFSSIDDDFYEELEETMIMDDMGVRATEEIIEELKQKVKENKVKDPQACRQLLIDTIREKMDLGENAYEFENRKSIVMLIGVNGVGKTTSIGKLADQLKAEGKKVVLAAADTFRAAAIDQLAKNLFWGTGESEIEQVFAIKIPHGYAYMHLDTVCTQVDYDKFTVYPGIYETLRAYRLTKGDSDGEVFIEEIEGTIQQILEMATGIDHITMIECGAGDPIEASREQWNDGSNTLAVAPGKVCVYERNVVTNDALYKAGVELLVAPSEELSRGRGGPRCMTMPFWREEI